MEPTFVSRPHLDRRRPAASIHTRAPPPPPNTASAESLASTGCCGLPDAWRGRRRFVVGELGFGTGLNILALLDLWRGSRPPGGRLHVFSVEAHLMSRAEAARALAPWTELADLAQRLLDRWPARVHGFHRLDLDDLGCTLDLAVMEALARR